MDKENCVDVTCPAHYRVDSVIQRAIPGTKQETVSAITYVGEYAVYTAPCPTPHQGVAIGILDGIKVAGGELRAQDAVNKMPSVFNGADPEALFRVAHVVNVIRVGHGSLSDVSNETESWREGVLKHADRTPDGASAMELHNDLVVMAGAGLFDK